MASPLFPWGAMLRAALSAGIAPEAFWRLSLCEWRWLAGDRGTAMDRGRLDALMGNYPDGMEPCATPSSEAAQVGSEPSGVRLSVKGEASG